MASGIAEEQAWQHFEDWAEEDSYFSLEQELVMLRGAGLGAECVWRQAPSAVVRARRS